MIRLPATSSFRCLLASAALFAFLVVAVSPPQAIAAVNAVRVTATDLSNFDLPVELSELGAPAVDQATYSVNGGSVQVSDGYSLKQILDFAAEADQRLDYTDARYITVGGIKVTPDRIDRPSARPPVFFESQDGVTFVQNAGGSSAGTKSEFTVSPLVSINSRKATFSVDLSASDSNPDAGETVTFEATAKDAPAGAQLEYRWNFGDGSPARITFSPKTSHRFTKAGSFPVTVTVTEKTGGEEAFAGQTLRIGKAARKDQGNKDTSDQGGGSGASSPPVDSGLGGSGFGSSGTGGSGSGNRGSGQAPSGGSPTAPVEENPADPVDGGLTVVSGELVSSTAPAATVDPSTGAVPETLGDASPEAGMAGLPGEVWAVTGILLLLGFGVLAERRGSRLG